MNRATLATVLLWAAAIVSAASTVMAQPPLTITEAGYFLTVVGDDGRPEMVELTTVIDLTDGNSPDDPDDPGGPDEYPFDLEIVKQVQQWAEEISDSTAAQAIAGAYAQIRDAVDDATLSPKGGLELLKDSTDTALGELKDHKDWAPFRERMTNLLNEKIQRGVLQTKRQVVLMLNSVFVGLKQSADGSEAVSLEVATKIAVKINEAIHACAE